MVSRQSPETLTDDERNRRETREALASTELFAHLPDAAVDSVLTRVERVEVRGDEVLFRQGDAGDAMYIVVSGRLQVVVETAPGVEAVVREMGRGENLGELALVTDEPRSATIRALRDSHLLRLSRSAFQALLRDHPETTMELTRILAGWLRDANQGMRPRGGIATVAVVPGTHGVAYAAFARSLTAALEAYGGAQLLDAAVLEDRFGAEAAATEEGGPGQGRITEWLNRQELHHRFVVYCADADATPWTHRCLRQADAILTVVHPEGADGSITAAGRAADQRAQERSTPRRLILLHETDSAPRDTGSWLRRGDFAAHHHVRKGDDGSTARVARHLAGRAVGVVLGGGGALGFAHVGVIRALREAGLEVDRFGGASMGALIAGMFANGGSAEDVLARLERWYARARYRPHQNRTVPIYSLDTGEQVRRMLGWDFGEVRIEDLWHPYFCTTTNLTTAESVVHREGPAARWIEASVAIPGVVPPVVTDRGELLADGGLLNNLPADIMKAGGDGPVVAVDVAADAELRVEPGSRAPSGWAGLLGRALPLRSPPEFPNIIRILHRSAVIGSVHSQRDVAGEVDLYLRPRLEGFDMFSWRSLRPIVEAGYQYAVERLESEPDSLPA